MSYESTMGNSSVLILAKMAIRTNRMHTSAPSRRVRPSTLPRKNSAAETDTRIGNAKTESDKSIGFALPIRQKLSLDLYGIFALVLTPAREL